MDEKSDFSNSRYYVYLLFSFKDSKFYIGYTSNLKRRLTEHANGKVTATKNRTPLQLLHYEYFINKSDAEAREKFLKSGYGRRQFKEILHHTLESLNKKQLYLID